MELVALPSEKGGSFAAERWLKNSVHMALFDHSIQVHLPLEDEIKQRHYLTRSFRRAIGFTELRKNDFVRETSFHEPRN